MRSPDVIRIPMKMRHISVFSRYGIHGFRAFVLTSRTASVRYHGLKDLDSSVDFYRELTEALAASPTPIRDIRYFRQTIGKCMNVEDWSMYWQDKQGYLGFLQSCAESENVNALFLLGLEEMFNRRKYDVGLHHLRLSSSQGHLLSKYVMGLWWVRDDSSRSHGIHLLKENFHATCSSKRVGKYMNVEDWSMYWHDKQGYLGFLQSCAESENFNALFLLGLEEMFNRRKYDLSEEAKVINLQVFQGANMKSKKIMKKPRRESGISSLPPELLEGILLQALAASPTPIRDIRYFRQTCKNFHAICSSKRIGKCMNVEDWSMCWQDKQGYLGFLQSCAKSENVNALFLLGLEEMFNRRKYDVGLHHLRLASSQGHLLSKYLMGLWWVRDDSSRSHGIHLLKEVSGNIHQCRRQASQIFSKMIWQKWPSLSFIRCEDLSCGTSALQGDNLWLHEEHVKRRFCSDDTSSCGLSCESPWVLSDDPLGNCCSFNGRIFSSVIVHFALVELNAFCYSILIPDMTYFVSCLLGLCLMWYYWLSFDLLYLICSDRLIIGRAFHGYYYCWNSLLVVIMDNYCCYNIDVILCYTYGCASICSWSIISKQIYGLILWVKELSVGTHYWDTGITYFTVRFMENSHIFLQGSFSGVNTELNDYTFFFFFFLFGLLLLAIQALLSNREQKELVIKDSLHMGKLLGADTGRREPSNFLSIYSKSATKAQLLQLLCFDCALTVDREKTGRFFSSDYDGALFLHGRTFNFWLNKIYFIYYELKKILRQLCKIFKLKIQLKTRNPYQIPRPKASNEVAKLIPAVETIKGHFNKARPQNEHSF
ncbi:hypothetical protein IEQ34_007446 [Dendrobium chrysotoxum]|uniref:At2g35280-like TPR domain-containing protein n=1 Tax=Dendrobium chrysotoxum TaxID=161865 RepID=A0AAV7HAW5_DENCH|nr:hypothetical protein IEQ34_007446 [Dendrobium chrysotoxum]